MAQPKLCGVPTAIKEHGAIVGEEPCGKDAVRDGMCARHAAAADRSRLAAQRKAQEQAERAARLAELEEREAEAVESARLLYEVYGVQAEPIGGDVVLHPDDARRMVSIAREFRQ